MGIVTRDNPGMNGGHGSDAGAGQNGQQEILHGFVLAKYFFDVPQVAQARPGFAARKPEVAGMAVQVAGPELGRVVRLVKPVFLAVLAPDGIWSVNGPARLAGSVFVKFNGIEAYAVEGAKSRALKSRGSPAGPARS